MANRRTSAQQALKDMKELNMDITFFTGNLMAFHMLNIEIGIVTKEKAEKVIKERKPKANKPKPKRYSWTPKPCTPKHVYNHTVIINPDGTVSSSFTEWDYK